MSGICGIVRFAGPPVERREVEPCIRAIGHRGPDGAGFYVSKTGRACLGAARLEIFKIPEDARQPAVSPDGSVAAVIDGMIYNDVEIHEALKSDAHVHDHACIALQAYLAWGDDFVERLRGEFIVAVYDARREALLLARGPLGVKLVFYREEDGAVTFASEIRGILASAGSSASVNPEGLYHFLTFGSVPPPYTLFEGINKLPPGTVRRFTRDGGRDRRYWRPMLKPVEKDISESAAIERVRDAFSTAVERAMRVDGVPGLYLSGGLDSSLVLALMRRHYSAEIRTFSLGFSGGDEQSRELSELPFARATAEKFGTKHAEIFLNPEDFPRVHAEVIADAEDPNTASQSAMMRLLAKAARGAGMKVMMTGEAGDAMFVGADLVRVAAFAESKLPVLDRMPRFIVKAAEALEKLRFRMRGRLPVNDFRQQILHNVARGRRAYWGKAFVISEEFKRSMLNADFARSCKTFDSHDVVDRLYRDIYDVRPRASTLHAYTALNLAVWIAEQGTRSYKYESARYGIEAAIPFLSSDLVTLIFSLPAPIIAGDGCGKYLLKKMAEPFLPHEIIYRKKLGFSSPLEDWWRKNLGAWLESLVDDGGGWLKYLDPQKVRRVIRVHQSGRQDLTWQLLFLINFAMWHARWMEGRTDIVDEAAAFSRAHAHIST